MGPALSRKINFENRALPALADKAEMAARLENDVLTSYESQTCTFARGLRGEERFEQAGFNFVGHAGPRVADA